MAETSARVGQVHLALRRAIIEQALEPGAKLPEDAIGERFGVSRTIVRRALERLASEELVRLRPNRGAAVASPSLEEARDLFAVRIDVECVVVRRLVGRLRPSQTERLEALAAEEHRAHREGRADYIRLAAGFHVVLGEMTGSAVLARFLERLVWRSALVLRLHGRPSWGSCNLEEHRALIAALGGMDVPAAERLMVAHLESVLTRALDGPVRRDEPVLAEILSRYAEPAGAK